MENKLHPLAAMILMNHDGLNNLGRGSPKYYSCQVTLYTEISPMVNDEKIFKVFYIDI